MDSEADGVVLTPALLSIASVTPDQFYASSASVSSSVRRGEW